MKRSKKLGILLGILVVACVVTLGVTQYQEKKEQIENSGEVVLELSADAVETLSWEYESQSLAFHKDDTWLYDDDEAFPVDQEKIQSLLEPFQAFTASFIIQDVEDLGQYGLDDPLCTIHITTGDESYDILLGDYSTMDSERYVSIGDGNVYLVSDDPLNYYDVELSDLIDHDEIPYLEQVSSMEFSGTESWQFTYQEEGGDSYRKNDVYFTQEGETSLPLDTTRVEDYIQTLSYLGLSDYVTYNATQEDLEACGLDDPELTIQVNYTTEDEDGNEVSDTLVLHISRDPEELADASQTSETAADSDETAEEEEITAYAQVGDSKILYRISSDDYKALMAASYDDLRHPEVLPADFADISQVDITLEGADYTITTEGDRDERTYFYAGEELEITDFQTALEALNADSFTDERPSQKEEIQLTVHLDLEGAPTVQISLYRYDGDSCLAVVDGDPVSLVPRSAVVDLIESVNTIVLN